MKFARMTLFARIIETVVKSAPGRYNLGGLRNRWFVPFVPRARQTVAALRAQKFIVSDWEG